MRDQIASELVQNADTFAAWAMGASNGERFSLENDYFTTPDAEVAYAMVRLLRPKTVIEVGSGHSTKVLRQALDSIGDRGDLISIDPQPRAGVGGLADQTFVCPVESLDPEWLLSLLRANDILFIDSSHEVRVGNDVIFLYSEVLPSLAPGVVVHIHDVFLPFHYPQEWIVQQQWSWTEQYLVLMIVLFSDSFEVLWASSHLQRTWEPFSVWFTHARPRRGCSLWLRKR
jgi:hypothetical protein